MAYINNTTSGSRFARKFAPALNNIRMGAQPGQVGKLGTPTPKFTPPSSGKPDISGMVGTSIAPAWKTALQGKSVPGVTQGPIQAKPPVTTTPTSQGVTQPTQGNVGTTTNVGTTAAPAVSGLVPAPTNVGTQNQQPTNTQGTAYSGYIKDIAGASAGSREQKRLQQRLEREAQANKAIGENARQISEDYGKEIAQVGKLGAGAVAGNLSTGSNVVGSGNAAIASQSASQRMSALGTAQQAALAGTGQQLTSQAQTQSGLNQALGSANTQQAQQLSGLGTAAGFSAPQVAAYGQTVFDPTQGQFAGGNMDPQTQATNLAQQVMSGAMTYDQALASLGYAGAAGSNFLNNAITGAGGNPLQLQASGVAQQGNITTAGTAGTDIARSGLGSATEQYVQMNTAANTAHSQSQALLNIMNTANINGEPLIRVNKAWNQILQETSDPNIASYFAALEEARGAYSALLSTGGSAPTENDRKSIGILSGNSTPQATAAAIQQLEDAVARKLQSQYSAMQQYSQNLGSGSTGYSGGGGGGFAEAW